MMPWTLWRFYMDDRDRHHIVRIAKARMEKDGYDTSCLIMPERMFTEYAGRKNMEDFVKGWCDRDTAELFVAYMEVVILDEYERGKFRERKEPIVKPAALWKSYDTDTKIEILKRIKEQLKAQGMDVTKFTDNIMRQAVRLGFYDAIDYIVKHTGLIVDLYMLREVVEVGV